jgi:negative regulator of sigma-B (phosphoserine phosphatase)
MAEQPPESATVDWAVAALPLEGESESGDVHVAEELPNGILLGVIDGLGHGPEAAVAARRAVAELEARPEGSLASRVRNCHEALRRTRGAVMTLVAFDVVSRTMTWVGVGNIDGLLIRAHGGTGRAAESIMLRGGVVGHQLPVLRESELAVLPGDVLVLVTDGIDGGFRSTVSPTGTAQEIADRILSRHARPSDDALVLVARLLPVE